MNWLVRLKKIETAPERDAIETTKRVSVVFAAPCLAPAQNTEGDSSAANGLASSERDALENLTKPNIAAAANDPAQVAGLFADALVAPVVTGRTLVSSGKVSMRVSTAQVVIDDPDRWAWRLSEAMTGREIDTFTARLARFTDKGLGLDAAESLADKLVTRDRESDDRRLCVECVHLAGYATGAWGCNNWQRAGVAVQARDARLSAALVYQPQRCDGFAQQA